MTYTKLGLAALFNWMLWGDFCYTIMETVVPSILPLKQKALGSPNWVMGMILTTVPGVLGMFLEPWISFKSDRYRLALTLADIVLLLFGACAWAQRLRSRLEQRRLTARHGTRDTLSVLSLARLLLAAPDLAAAAHNQLLRVLQDLARGKPAYAPRDRFVKNWGGRTRLTRTQTPTTIKIEPRAGVLGRCVGAARCVTNGQPLAAERHPAGRDTGERTWPKARARRAVRVSSNSANPVWRRR